jgi:hypothetical protein
MKARSLITFLIPLVVIFISCSDDENVVEPYSNNPELSKKIVGTWEYGDTELRFNDYGLFTKRNRMYDYTNDSLRSVVTQFGTYEIIDSLLILKTERWQFSHPDRIRGISIVPIYAEISFSDGVMIYDPVYAFTKENSKKESLLGKWKMTQWVYHKITEPKVIEYTGRQELYYNFVSSDSMYTWRRLLSPSEFKDYHWKSSYQYSPPYITLPGDGIYDARVKFKNDKMYWYVKDNPVTYSKLN